MRRRLVALHASMMGGVVLIAACFPDPPADSGILDSGIFLLDSAIDGAADDGATSGLTLSTQTLDFGLNECGGVAPANQTLTLTNTSSGSITYGAAVSGNQFALASAPTGALAAGATVDIAISSLGVSSFATAGGITEGALQIVTDAPGQKRFVVDLRETAKGAELVMIPSTANFGLVEEESTSNLNVGFRNDGNAPLTITFDDVPFFPFTLQSDDDAGAGFAVAAGTTTLLQATYMAGEGSSSQEIGFHTSGVLCGGGDPPASLTLKGQSTIQTETISPGILTFDVGGTGYVPCGQASTSRSVTVANSNESETQTFAITSAQITSGSFTVSPTVDTSDGGAGIMLAQGGTQVFTVTPSTLNAPVPTSPEGASGVLHIELSNQDAFDVALSQTAQGAVLTFAPPSIDFGNAPLDYPTMQLLGVTNSGNAAVNLTLNVAGSPYFSASPSAAFSVNTPGGSSSVTFLPIAAGAAQGTVTLTPSGPICSVAPAGVALTGNGSPDASIPDAGVFDSGFDLDGAVMADAIAR